MRIPDTDEAFINFSRDHIDIWSGGQSTPPDTGLSAAQLAATEAATAAAEAADLAARQARTLAKTKTAAKREAIGALRAVIGGDIDTIDAYAKATGDPGVYERAQIPAPRSPSEREAPPAPVFGPVVQNSGGVVAAGFKVVAGGGAQYTLQRRDTSLDGSVTDWRAVATLTEKAFEDPTIPLGLRKVEYRVRAQLSTGAASPWSNEVGFNFGSLGSQAGPMASAGSIVPVKAEDQKSAG